MSSPEMEIARVFEPLLKPVRWKGAKGGRGSGKSYFFGEMAAARMAGKPCRVLGVREYQNSIRDSVKATVSGIIRKHQLPGFDILEHEIRHKNGSLMVFKGMQDNTSEAVKSLEDFDIAWVEEGQNLSQRSFDTLYPTIRKPKSELWFSWNPRYKEDPVDKFFNDNYLTDSNVTMVTANWRDNPWFSDELNQDRLRDLENDPARYAHVWEGEYATVLHGAYWAREIAEAVTAGRVRKVEHDRAANTYAAFDLGMDDATAIWIFQAVAGEWRFLRYYEAQGHALAHYIDWLRKLPYTVDLLFLPHDAEVREQQSGKSRKTFFEERGFATKVLKRTAVEDGIEAVRMILPRSYWDREGTAQGLHAARNYRTDYNEKTRAYALRPMHDWASHGADALRYAVMGINEHYQPNVKRSNWDKPIARASAGTYV
jgi:phage terminase large subunit